MGLFGKSKKEREKEYMNRLDVPLCLKEDFELIIDDVFTIMGVGTVATGNISTGMCREGENACVYKTNGGVLETIITTIDIHTKERKSNGCGYKTEHVGLGLRGVSKEQLENILPILSNLPKVRGNDLGKKVQKEYFENLKKLTCI